MAKKIMNYTVLGAASTGELTKLVVDAMRQGWEPYWGPSADRGVIFQALVLKEEEE